MGEESLVSFKKPMTKQSWLEGDENVVRWCSELDEVMQWWLEQRGEAECQDRKYR